MSYHYVDPDDDRDDQPGQHCDCPTGRHAPECLRWTPPLAGPGSSEGHRAAALAHIRAVLADAHRRHQETL